jgi:hypothetical protein
MKHNLLCLLTFLFFFSKSQPAFQKTFGSTGSDYAMDVIQTADKGYAVMGVMNFGGVYILKTDSLGNKQWSKNLGLVTPSQGEFRSFSQTNDGGFIFGGYINYSSNYYGYIVKLDASGNITWQKMHSVMGRSIFSVKQTIEGDYIAVGSQTLYQYSRGTILRLNSSGNITWNRTLPVVNTAMDVVQLSSDSSFITCYFANNHTDNATFSRWSKTGNLMWTKTLNSPTVGVGSSGHLRESGNEVQVAVSANGCPGILKMTKDGTNAKVIAAACPSLNSYFIADAFPTYNKGSVILASHTVNSPYQTRNNILMQVDSMGTIKWAKQIGGVNDEYPGAVVRTKDHGIVFAGSTKSFSVYRDDIYLVKTDSLGQGSCNTSLLSAFTTSIIPGMLSVYTGTVDSIYGNITSTQAVTISNPSEISYDACGCVAPVASFTPSTIGDMQENSTWATKWYWTCTCLPGQVDSTTIDKGYYGGPFPNGTYTVCLTVKNSCGVDSLCQPFNYVFWPLGVNEKTETTGIGFYPNPVHDKLFISQQGYATNREATGIKIINSLGALVYSDKMEGTMKEIQVDGLAPGLYFIQFTSGSKTITKKVIKE